MAKYGYKVLGQKIRYDILYLWFG